MRLATWLSLMMLAAACDLPDGPDEAAEALVGEGGIRRGATWEYWDRRDPVAAGWKVRAEKERWRGGAGPLGYGEPYLATTVGSKAATAYFRRDFAVDDPAAVTSLMGEVMYDDRVVVYLNGHEVARHGLPAGEHEAGNAYETFDWSAARAFLVPGVNVIAAEVHQAGPTSNDLVFDLALDVTTAGTGWRWQDSGTTAYLTDVWFTDAQHGWVVGDGGTILRTINGGATWDLQPSGVGANLLGSIEFADAQHGWIAGVNVVLATVDGGDSWFVQSTVHQGLGDLSFASATTGWLAAEHLYRTDDGGATWHIQLHGSSYIDHHTVDFVDATNGWVIARTASGNGDIDGAIVVLRTRNGGITWQRQLEIGDWEQSVGALDAVSPTLAWIGGVGREHTQLDEYKHVTRDGLTWQQVPDSLNDTAIYDLQFIDDSRGWAVGFGGSIVHTTDGGATWQVQQEALWEYESGGSNPLAPSLKAVQFLDDRTGWAVGAGGTILATTGGGIP